MSKKQRHIMSSGNVFADLGFADSAEMLAKAELAHKISTVISERQLTQAQAARILGVDQPKISALTRGRLSGFSLERMVRFLLALGCDVEIQVRRTAAARRQARLRVA